MKDKSGLFTGTSGTTAALKAATVNAVNTGRSKSSSGKKKAAIIGAFDIRTGKIVVAYSGSIPKNIHPELQKRANKIGGVGSFGVSSKNIVGGCAEFHVVNSLLNMGSNISDIHFVQPVRPRNGKPLNFCDNCQAMFSDIISKGV